MRKIGHLIPFAHRSFRFGPLFKFHLGRELDCKTMFFFSFLKTFFKGAKRVKVSRASLTLAPDLLFDCSCVLHKPKHRAVLQSIRGFNQCYPLQSPFCHFILNPFCISHYTPPHPVCPVWPYARMLCMYRMPCMPVFHS